MDRIFYQRVAKSNTKHGAWVLTSFLGRLASGHDNGSIRVWELENHLDCGDSYLNPLLEWQAHAEGITCLVSWDKQEDKKKKRIRKRRQQPHQVPLLLSGGQDNCIKVWDACGRLVHQVKNAHNDMVMSMCLVNGHLLSCGIDGQIKRWKMILQTQKLKDSKWSWFGHLLHKRHIAPESENSDPVVVFSVKMELLDFIDLGVEIHCLCNTQGGSFWSGSEDKIIRCWNQELMSERIMCAHKDSLSAFCRWNNLIVSCADDGIILVWNSSTGNNVAKLEGHETSEALPALCVWNNYLCSGSHDGTIRIWNKKFECVTILPCGDSIEAVFEWHDMLCCGTLKGEIQVFQGLLKRNEITCQDSQLGSTFDYCG